MRSLIEEAAAQLRKARCEPNGPARALLMERALLLYRRALREERTEPAALARQPLRAQRTTH